MNRVRSTLLYQAAACAESSRVFSTDANLLSGYETGNIIQIIAAEIEAWGGCARMSHCGLYESKARDKANVVICNTELWK